MGDDASAEEKATAHEACGSHPACHAINTRTIMQAYGPTLSQRSNNMPYGHLMAHHQRTHA
jgi:hypothetical protein